MFTQFAQNSSAQAPAINNLQRLFVLRNTDIAIQVLAVMAASQMLKIALPLVPIVASIAFLALINFFTWLRLKRLWPVTDLELFAQLLVDVAALAVLLYFSGGSTNPFASLFLLPLTIAAAALPWGYTWAMAAITMICYTALLVYHIPLPPPGTEHLIISNPISMGPSSVHIHGGARSDFSLHVIGMWFNFLVSASLISYFVVKMAGSIRERDLLLASAREEALRNERIIALGTLAAGAAHELGTPLSTMAVVAKELQQDCAGNPELVDDLRILRDQVDNCKHILSDLLASAGQPRAQGGTSLPLDRYFEELLDKWQLMRPGITIKTEWEGSQPAPQIVSEQTLSQAIMNLLNNAADVSPDNIEIHFRWNESEFGITILDRGPGLTPEVVGNAGKPFFTTKAPGSGIGIGLFLANATIERFGGSVRLFNRDGGGASTEVMLPLLRLQTMR